MQQLYFVDKILTRPSGSKKERWTTLLGLHGGTKQEEPHNMNVLIHINN